MSIKINAKQQDKEVLAFCVVGRGGSAYTWSIGKYPNIIHISGEEIDKGDLLKALNEHANLSKRYVLQDQKKFNFSLDGSLFTKISKLHLPSINEQIKELLDERL